MPPDAVDRRNATAHPTAHYFLEALVETGIEYLFCNLGTDHAPIIEEIARWAKAGRKLPKIVASPHENVAMHMGGYPEGDANDQELFQSGLARVTDFSKMAEGFGACREKLVEPADVPASIARCLDAVHQGRSALLHACVTKL
jgi:thiamine pyrophosphate-dependent acetolactate synthase large subunit-like protein